MPQPPKKDLRSFSSLTKVVEQLRGPDGCPWDKEQTHQTLTRFAIEEAYELAEAIDSEDTQAVIEELGDLLLQVVLHSEIARQAGTFSIEDVVQAVCNKMIRRHPHVFGEHKLSTSTEVLQQWHKIKEQEKAQTKPSAENKSALNTTSKPLSFDIPIDLPALLRCQKIGEKTKKVNFDWLHVADVFAKVEEEIGELRHALATLGHPDSRTNSLAETESELGDTLFSLAQLARHLNLDAEQALRKTNQRFEQRFHTMCTLINHDGLEMTALSSCELERYWQRAKTHADLR